MRPETLSDAIGKIDDELIMEADRRRNGAAEKAPNRKRRIKMLRIAAASAACIVIAGVSAALALSSGSGEIETGYDIADSADMPVTATTTVHERPEDIYDGGAGDTMTKPAVTSAIREDTFTQPPVTENAGVTGVAGVTEAPVREPMEPEITTAEDIPAQQAVSKDSASPVTAPSDKTEDSAEQTVLTTLRSIIYEGRELFPVPVEAMALAEASYPALAKYPDEKEFCDTESGELDSGSYNAAYDAWDKLDDERYEAGKAIGKELYGFYKQTAPVFLEDSGGNNRVYSPVNIYEALSVLAEVTGGNSRGQILSLLGESDIASLRSRSIALWNACHRGDGGTTTLLANSLWLGKGLYYDPATVEMISKVHYTSVFGGDLSSEETTSLLRKWLDDQTGGFLSRYTGQAEFSPETVLSIASTVHFGARWMKEFDPGQNDTRVFYGTKKDAETEFMNRTEISHIYYYGSDYSATVFDFADRGSMWFILPDMDKTVSDVLAEGEFLDMVSAGYLWDKKTLAKMNISVPKFDYGFETSIVEPLKKLGVTDIFDFSVSDFSSLTGENDTPLYVSEVKRAARVRIDEKGCASAEYTIIDHLMGEGGPETDKIDFILDRPFIFVIMSDTTQPIFIGTVNDLSDMCI